MNDHEIERIAAAVNQLRPDWPVKSLRTLIAKNLATRARRDVMVAFAWVACEPNTASPARVLEAGPWWRAAATEGSLVPRHATPVTACRTCGRDLADDCCDRPAAQPAPTDRNHEHAEAARAALRGDR